MAEAGVQERRRDDLGQAVDVARMDAVVVEPVVGARLSTISSTHMSATIATTSSSAFVRSGPRRSDMRRTLPAAYALRARRWPISRQTTRARAAGNGALAPPVLVAALAVLPLLALPLTHPHGALAVVEIAGHWVVWLTFMVEVVVMLCVVRDRRAWIDGHRFELLVVAVSSPLVPLALALAPALRLLILAKLFKTLKLAKAIKLAKLGKSVQLLRRKLALDGAASVALGVLALALAAVTVVLHAHRRVAVRGRRAHDRARRRRDARDVRRQPPAPAPRRGVGADRARRLSSEPTAAAR